MITKRNGNGSGGWRQSPQSNPSQRISLTYQIIIRKDRRGVRTVNKFIYEVIKFDYSNDDMEEVESETFTDLKDAKARAKSIHRGYCIPRNQGEGEMVDVAYISKQECEEEFMEYHNHNGTVLALTQPTSTEVARYLPPASWWGGGSNRWTLESRSD